MSDVRPAIWQWLLRAAKGSMTGADNFVEGLFGRADRHARSKELARQYGDDASSIEYAPVGRFAFASFWVLLLLLGVALIWMIFGQVDRVVIAQGKLETRSPLIVMQPLAPSRILKILVKPGDRVRAGQTLVQFDPSFARADQASSATRVRTLTAEIERIRAELAGRPYSPGAAASEEQRTQAEIYAQRKQRFSSARDERAGREKAVTAQMQSNRETIDGLRTQLALAHEVVSMRENLEREGAGSRLETMTARSTVADLDARIKALQAEVSRLAQQHVEIVAERNSFLSQWQNDLNQRLLDASAALGESDSALKKADTLTLLSNLAAPVDAEILEMADRSVGSVIQQAETVVTLVPDNAELLVEAQIQTRDVGFVSAGNDVRIKLEAYPYQTYGTLNGQLQVVSADSIQIKDGDRTALAFRAQIRLTDPIADIARRGIRLRPGLVATAEIKTGRRSIASYVFSPILRTAQEGMREP